MGVRRTIRFNAPFQSNSTNPAVEQRLFSGQYKCRASQEWRDWKIQCSMRWGHASRQTVPWSTDGNSGLLRWTMKFRQSDRSLIYNYSVLPSQAYAAEKRKARQFLRPNFDYVSISVYDGEASSHSVHLKLWTQHVWTYSRDVTQLITSEERIFVFWINKVKVEVLILSHSALITL